MSTIPENGQAQYYFRSTESADGTPWIICEAQGPELEILKGTVFGIELHSGTTLKQADEIAAFLRNAVSGFSYTKM